MKIVRSGFTLAEVLIAIAIFASLVLMAQQVANGLSNVNVVVTEHDHKLKALQQTMSFMSHDLTQIVPRQMRRENGQWESSFLAGEGVLLRLEVPINRAEKIAENLREFIGTDTRQGREDREYGAQTEPFYTAN